MADPIKFTAEVKKVSSKKLASLDIEYQVTMSSSDPNVLNLGLLAADVLLDVEVNINGEE